MPQKAQTPRTWISAEEGPRLHAIVDRPASLTLSTTLNWALRAGTKDFIDMPVTDS
jgi:hypothetical protein